MAVRNFGVLGCNGNSDGYCGYYRCSRGDGWVECEFRPAEPADYEIPFAFAYEFSESVTAIDFEESFGPDAEWVCCVSIPQDALSVLGEEGKPDARLAVYGLEAECPYCKTLQRLELGRWRAIETRSNRFRRPFEDIYGVDRYNDPSSSVVCDLSLASFPLPSWCRVVPLAEEGDYFPPSGRWDVVAAAASELRQGRLMPGENGETVEVGYRGPYLGAYQCRWCDGLFGVSYNYEAPGVRYGDSWDTPIFEKVLIRLMEQSDDRAGAYLEMQVTDVDGAPVSPCIRLYRGSGLIEMDGLHYLGSSLMVPNNWEAGHLFENEGVLRIAAHLLGLSDFDRAGVLSFRRLALGNRFRGYPSNLIRDLEHKLTTGDLVGSALQLPHNADNIEECFRLCGLPNCEAVKRVAYSRPSVIAAALSGFGIPFEDVYVVERLLRAEEAPWLVHATSHYASAAAFWRYVAETVGERNLLDWMLERGARDLHADSFAVWVTIREPRAMRHALMDSGWHAGALENMEEAIQEWAHSYNLQRRGKE